MQEYLVNSTENIFRKQNLKQETMKTRLIQIILGTFLLALLIGGNVNAKGTELIVVSGLEYIIETEMEVEEWMINEYYWTNSDETYYFNNYSEDKPAIEEWMVDRNKWLPKSFEYPLTESEHQLKIECWMISETNWN